MIPNVGGAEVLVILIVILIFIGPDKMPDVMRQAGKAKRQVDDVRTGIKKELDGVTSDFKAAMDAEAGTAPPNAKNSPAAKATFDSAAPAKKPADSPVARATFDSAAPATAAAAVEAPTDATGAAEAVDGASPEDAAPTDGPAEPSQPPTPPPSFGSVESNPPTA